MARKRKKSKARQKGRKDRSPAEARSAADEKTAEIEATSDAAADDEAAEASKKTKKAKKANKSTTSSKKKSGRKSGKSSDEAAEGAEADRIAEEPERQAPLIGPDALVALSQFRAEGVATVPGELVLDLGDPTSAEERDRLLAAALAHVEMQDAIYRVPLEAGSTRRWKAVIASVLFVMALFLVGLPPSFLVPEPPAPMPAGERLRGVRVALLLQAQQIEAHRVRHDRLPRSLAEVPVALPGIRYVRSNERLFQLIGYTPDGEAVVYDSASPDAAFDALAESWIAPRDDS